MKYLFNFALGAAPFSRGTPCNVPLDPFVASSLIGGGANLIGGAINNIVNRSNMQKQIDASKELMNYQWRNFQSYEAQSNSMKKAGLNPAAMFGQSGASSASPSVSMPTIAPSTIGSDLAGAIQAAAQAKKIGAEEVAQNIENEVNSQVVNERIKAVGLQNKYSEEQINNLQQEWNKLTAQINSLSTDREIKQLELEKTPELLNSVLRQYSDRHNLDKQNYEALKEQLPVILDKLKHEEKILSIDADISENFKNTMAGLGVVGQALQIITKFISIFK